MISDKVYNVLKQYFDEELLVNVSVSIINSGLINDTYKIEVDNELFILQKINKIVFAKPTNIQSNIHVITSFLEKNNVDFVYPLIFKSLSNNLYVLDQQMNYWRMFKYIANSESLNKLGSNSQAYFAAKLVGRFHCSLLNFNTQLLLPSIDGFLNFKKRFIDFKSAINNADSTLLKKANGYIQFVIENEFILSQYLNVEKRLPHRVIHADTKIGNFLFNVNSGSPIALIDFDTLMRGPLIYDFGDMIRSFTNLKKEDEQSKGSYFSLEIYDRIKKGYIESVEGHIDEIEYNDLDLGAKAVIYIQCLRFLTDYLNGDVYYKVDDKYHNLRRAHNQIQLLTEMIEFI
jgi:Ser/Thr protein kinase RdoA (MazF antagonist)